MTTTLRTAIASAALAFSAVVLTAGADPRELGLRVLPFLVVLLAHAWVVAVGERVGSERGGVEIRRCPLGPRLAQARPGLYPQMVVLVVLLGLALQDLRMIAIGLAIVTFLMVDLLRGLLPYVLPVLGVLAALLTMDEFHTLGDLVLTARGWALDLGLIALWALVFSGPLLRTDVSPPVGTGGRLVALAAGLPAYGAAAWVFTRSPLAGRWPDLYALGLALLVGGLVQSLLVGGLASTVGIQPRHPRELPAVCARDVGFALLPLSLPLLVALGWMIVPTAQVGPTALAPVTWAGVLTLTLIVPAVPLAVLVAAGIDRADGRRGATAWIAGGVVALLGWCALGPEILRDLYAPQGPVASLASALPVAGSGSAAVAGLGDGLSVFGAALGGGLTLYGVAAADLVRAVGLMLLLGGLASLCLLRHAPRGLRGPRWRLLLLMVAAFAGGAWFALPRYGAVGAPLAAAAAALVLIVADLLTGVVEEPEPELSMPFEEGGVEDRFEDAFAEPLAEAAAEPALALEAPEGAPEVAPIPESLAFDFGPIGGDDPPSVDEDDADPADDVESLLRDLADETR